MAPAAPADAQKLPKKEAEIFKNIVKFYETKQYKKGLKAADAVLKKAPNHGETLAMRGLVLNCLDRKEEAYDYVKRGLRADMRSHVCWHVYGLLYRSDRDYEQAIKSYKQALKIDADNVQILRDLSLLQIQLRDARGFLKTRHKLLTQKPNNKMHWIAYALANHLAGFHATAIQVIDAYGDTLKGQEPPSRSYEDSELALYRTQILEEDGRYADALKHLDASKDLIVDGHGLAKKRAELLLYAEAGDGKEAREAWRALLRRTVGADNYDFQRGFQCALLRLPGAECRRLLKTMTATRTPTDVVALDAGQVEELDAAYAELAAEFPRADAFAWLPLTYRPAGASFDACLDALIVKFVKRGAPALGSALERLWAPSEGDVVEGRSRGVACCRACLARAAAHAASLDSVGTFAGSEAPAPPTARAWCSYLAAHCHEWLGQLAEAFGAIDEAIKHTPTCVDFYEKRARLLKRSGRPRAAADAMVAAREMDLADRYINNKATKYLLRAGDVEEARRTAALFTREEAGDAEAHLKDMQASWYELEVGRALAAEAHAAAARGAAPDELRRLAGPALKLLCAVEQHFADFIEDQFDFHTYCVRKMTLRAYVACLRMEDEIRGHKHFRNAAGRAAAVYLALHDADVKAAATAAAPSTEADAADDKRAKALAKREKAKQRKAARKAAEAPAPAAEATDTDKKKKADKREVDEDPKGEKLAAKPPLEEASRLATMLDKYAAGRGATQALVVDVALRRNKPLVALRALRRLEKTDDRAAFVRALAALAAARPTLSDLNPAVASVLDAELASLCGGTSALDACRAFAKAHPRLPERVAASDALALLGAPDASLVLDAETAPPPLGRPLGVGAFEAGLAAVARVDAAAAARFLSEARARFPDAVAFAAES